MKKILVISLLLALVMALVLPTAAMAASPARTNFGASGYLTGIDTGNVKQLGHSGKWLVRNRTIEGFVSGDINGDFDLKYDGIFDLATQAGNLVGTLKAADALLLVTAEVAPLEMVETNLGFSLPMLTISGKWIGLSGVRANGDFQAYMVFIPDGEGHVLQVVDSGFFMTGKFNGKR